MAIEFHGDKNQYSSLSPRIFMALSLPKSLTIFKHFRKTFSQSSSHGFVFPHFSQIVLLIQEVLEERESENARLKHQLHTAEQLLREAPKDLGDSRPNSFVSNSSSSATSAGEMSSDSQINGERITLLMS